jgi:hypothetical protein
MKGYMTGNSCHHLAFSRGIKITGSRPHFVTRKSCSPFSHSLTTNPGANCTSNRRIKAHTVIRISWYASAFPTHIDGPNEKGMNARRSCIDEWETCAFPGLYGAVGDAFGLSEYMSGAATLLSQGLSQRSGRKASGNGEKYRRSRWRE